MATTSLNTVASVTLTFFVTLALNTAINYYSGDKGTIGVSRAVPIAQKSYTVVSVENYSREFMDGVVLEIPSTVALSEITSDPPVTLTDAPSPHQARTRQVRVGQIAPRFVTRIFIPTSDPSTGALVRVVNSDAAGLALRHDNELESPLRRALLLAALSAVIYAVFAAGVTYFLRQEMRSLRESVEVLSARNKVSDTRIREIEARLTKHRLLLQARLADYAKELNFWRDTIRSLVQVGGKSSSDVVDLVTARLGTFGTKSGTAGFDSVRVAAAWLAEAEAHAQTKNSDIA